MIKKVKKLSGWSVLFWLGLFAVAGCQSTLLPTSLRHQSQPVPLGNVNEGQAPALLSLPESLELMAFNEQPVPLLYRGRPEFALPAGEHTLAVRYVDIWMPGDYPGSYGHAHDVVRSEPRRLSVTLKGGVRYQFEAPPQFKTPDEAREFVSTFKPQILMHSNAVRVAQVAPSHQENASSTEEPMTPQQIQARSDSQNEAALKAVPDQKLLADIPLSDNRLPEQTLSEATANPVDHSPLVESMKVLWRQLSVEEKQRFRAFLDLNASN